jgi:hypothetical protein
MSGNSSLHVLANHRLVPLIAVGSLAAVIGCGVWLGLPLGLLAAAAVVLTLVISLMWQSLQHLSGETELSFEEALSLAAPTAAEEQKRAVLRALKDLEYERSVGKISEQDFLELSERYRADAKRLILAVDDTLQERRREAEELLSRRLRASVDGSGPSAAPSKKKRRKPAQGRSTESTGSAGSTAQKPFVTAQRPPDSGEESASPTDTSSTNEPNEAPQNPAVVEPTEEKNP